MRDKLLPAVKWHLVKSGSIKCFCSKVQGNKNISEILRDQKRGCNFGNLSEQGN